MAIENLGPDSANTMSFAIGVGESVKLCPPVLYPPAAFDTQNNYQQKGFKLLNTEIGEFTSDPEDSSSICVVYKHNRSGKQIVQYVSRGLGEKYFYAILEGITIHDHGSIYQGGPAFATYYAETERTEEGG